MNIAIPQRVREPEPAGHVLQGCVAAVILLLSGCGGGSDKWISDREPTYPSSGVVTINGQPVGDAQVTFRPFGTGPAAFARTNADGRFALRTYTDEDGAAAGEYAVTVEKRAANESPAPASDPQELFRKMEQGQTSSLPQSRSLLPAQYADAKSSGLRFTVTPDGPNQFTIELRE